MCPICITTNVAGDERSFKTDKSESFKTLFLISFFPVTFESWKKTKTFVC